MLLSPSVDVYYIISFVWKEVKLTENKPSVYQSQRIITIQTL